MMRFGNGMGQAMKGYFPGMMPMVLGGLCMLAMVALLVIILILVIRLYKKINCGSYTVSPRQSSPYSNSPAAMDILSERLAKGEISDEEYAAKKELLMK